MRVFASTYTFLRFLVANYLKNTQKKDLKPQAFF